METRMSRTNCPRKRHKSDRFDRCCCRSLDDAVVWVSSHHRSRGRRGTSQEGRSHHVCRGSGAIERWAWFHIEVEGGTLINRIDDVRPDDPDSQHEDLVHRLRRVRRRPDRGHRSGQEVAGHQVRRASRRPLVPARRVRHPRPRQVRRPTSRRWAARRAARCSCATTASASSSRCSPAATPRVTRPRRASPSTASDPRVGDSADDVAITFAEETGKGFYDQIEDAVAAGDEAPFFDFARMPADWQVPAPSPKQR